MKSVIAVLFAGICFQACNFQTEKSASPTFGGAFFSSEVDLDSYYSVTFSDSGVLDLNENWEFLGADSFPGIDMELPVFPKSQTIELPHRLPLPNHSIWYRLRGNWDDGFLHINGDDGVQLWENSQQTNRNEPGDFFPISAQTDGELIIRVVNNAMAGGLRSVKWMSGETFKRHKASIDSRRDSIFAVRKLELLQDPELKMQLEGLNSVEIQNLLSEYPILLTEPALLMSPDGKFIIRWVSEKSGSMTLTFQDETQKTLDSNDGVFSLEIEQGQELSFRMSQEKSQFGNFSFSVPIPAESVKLVVWADSQGGWDTFAKLVKLINSHQPDLSIGVGDLVSDGSEELAYPRLLSHVSSLSFPQLLIPGNHDYDGFYEDLNPQFLKKYISGKDAKTYGLQFFGPVGLVSLDPNENFPVEIKDASSQADWFHKTMLSEEWKASPWKIIMLHQPPYSQGWPGYHGEKSIRKLLEPYFHAGLIDLVISGHTHDYERLTSEFSGNPVTFLIVGGAGGGLEPEGEDSEFPVMDRIIKQNHFGMIQADSVRLELEVFGLKGEKLDSLILRNKTHPN
jgi:Icc-related predicted phosphoesterase